MATTLFNAETEQTPFLIKQNAEELQQTILERLLKKVRHNIDVYAEQITELQETLQTKGDKLINLFAEEKRLLAELNDISKPTFTKGD